MTTPVVPTASVFPGALDSSATLFGDPFDGVRLTLDGGINDAVETFTVNEALTNINVPTFFAFPTGEIVYCETKDAPGGYVFTNVKRGALASTPSGYATGTALKQILVSSYIKQLKDAVIHIETELGTDPAVSAADVATFNATHNHDGTLGEATIDLTAVASQIFISAAGMSPQATTGCAPLATTSMGTNKQDIKTLDFDKDAIEYAQSVLFAMPGDYDGGTFTYNILWKHAATTTNFKVAWAVDAVAYANDLTLDTAFGTAVQVNDTGGTTSDYYISPESTAVTPGGSAAANCGMIIRIRRVATDGTNDTMAIDAGLIGVQINYARA